MGEPRNTQEMREFVEIPARARRMYPRAGFEIDGVKVDTTGLQVLIALTLVGEQGKSISELAGDLVLDVSTVSHCVKALRGQQLVEDIGADGARNRPIRVTPPGSRAAREYVDVALSDLTLS
jgi:DNA-binding MarR family transcriptional regulator